MTAPRLLNTRDAAAYLNMPEGTLAGMRFEGRGPTYVKSGGYVRYRVEWLDEWLDRITVTPSR
ncbi:DNA-binding protein [Bifidobacterium tissieri]|uniref:DNA-binding protein n=1 Tax=Bifidobacterium tissieri TaxID=1630162 RepID=A0A5M9ZV09_9BIFI|nr:helix-turn-helix domain-containing protein [Bifidobacterium tissieri]KAA8831441.1 DNA-binding protein [Bifidobacterium tissieri]